MMPSTFENLSGKGKLKLTRYKKYCDRCGKSFKTTKWGKVCSYCRKNTFRKKNRKGIGYKRCKGVKRDGERCIQEGSMFGYCATHYKSKKEK